MNPLSTSTQADGFRPASDCEGYHIETRLLSLSDIRHGYILESNDRHKLYKLIASPDLLDAFILSPTAQLQAIISFQRYAAERRAVARLFLTRSKTALRYPYP